MESYYFDPKWIPRANHWATVWARNAPTNRKGFDDIDDLAQEALWRFNNALMRKTMSPDEADKFLSIVVRNVVFKRYKRWNKDRTRIVANEHLERAARERPELSRWSIMNTRFPRMGEAEELLLRFFVNTGFDMRDPTGRNIAQRLLRITPKHLNVLVNRIKLNVALGNFSPEPGTAGTSFDPDWDRSVSTTQVSDPFCIIRVYHSYPVVKHVIDEGYTSLHGAVPLLVASMTAEHLLSGNWTPNGRRHWLGIIALRDAGLGSAFLNEFQIPKFGVQRPILLDYAEFFTLESFGAYAMLGDIENMRFEAAWLWYIRDRRNHHNRIPSEDPNGAIKALIDLQFEYGHTKMRPRDYGL